MDIFDVCVHKIGRFRARTVRKNVLSARCPGAAACGAVRLQGQKNTSFLLHWHLYFLSSQELMMDDYEYALSDALS
ncbi:hypothetical protein, partial [uncultured Bacteroides sp.]|uniref:hypothetical protein n=1 Tax=uncultured Bacteroides sp. TaxID=162156 RepID=UPI0025D01582